MGCRTLAGQATEDGARRQPSAARVIVVEEPADRLFGRMDALDRVSSATHGLGQSNYHGLLGMLITRARTA